MKHTLKSFGLLLCLLLSIFVVGYVNADPKESTSIPSLSKNILHRSRLYNLKLGSEDSSSGALNIVSGASRMTFTKGLIVGDSSSVGGSVEYAVIGGGKYNKVGSDYAGTGGGQSNEANAMYAVIGGGSGNQATGENSVVVGGNGNKAEGKSSVVVGGSNNTTQGLNSVVLGGWSNVSLGKNSLALGRNSKSHENAFAWGGEASSGSAYIGATKGTLIGTTESISGVNLVVSGAIKIGGGSKNYTGEIKYENGCYHAYDGNNRHIINKGSSTCGQTASSCRFGNTILWHGDVATGYSDPYAVNCPSPQELTCSSGHLITSTGALADSYYPYCYTIHK